MGFNPLFTVKYRSFTWFTFYESCTTIWGFFKISTACFFADVFPSKDTPTKYITNFGLFKNRAYLCSNMFLSIDVILISKHTFCSPAQYYFYRTYAECFIQSGMKTNCNDNSKFLEINLCSYIFPQGAHLVLVIREIFLINKFVRYSIVKIMHVLLSRK